MISPAVKQQRTDRLRAVRIYAITDARPRLFPLEDFLAASIAAGVGMVQLRDKTLSDAELLAVEARCAATCRRHGALFVVNDRADVALACGADGVHVGQDDLPSHEVRKLVGNDFIVGLSTHSSEQVDQAQTLPLDYIAVGPVHATPTKPGRPAVGLELVAYAAAKSRLPFFAIGGLDPSNAAPVIAAGAHGISILRCLTQASDPGAVGRALVEKFPS